MLHPGNCKQNVPVTLAIFDETTSVAIAQYFPERKEDVSILGGLFPTGKIIFQITFWGMPQKKVSKKENSYAQWLGYWHSERIPNCQ